MKKIINIIIGDNNATVLYKDVGAILYSLGKDYGWDATFLYLSRNGEAITNPEFEKFAHILCGGIDSGFYDDRKNIIYSFIKNYIHEYDIVYFMGYGSTLYKMAYLCKKVHPRIKVYIKMDMNENGFAHFREVSLSRKLKNYFEYIKSRYVDYFSVENKIYFDMLKNITMFKNRLLYIPNGVSTIGVDVKLIDKSVKKENIIISVNRFGNLIKNAEDLIRAFCRLPEKLICQWKFYLVGPQSKEFEQFLKDIIEMNPIIGESIISVGEITNRQELYELYAKSKIFAMTSRTESFCIAAAEASYFGCIPILTYFGDIVETLTNGRKFGYVVEQNSIDQYAKALQMAMELSPNELEEQVSLIKKYGRKIYNYKSIVKTLVDVFEEKE